MPQILTTFRSATLSTILATAMLPAWVLLAQPSRASAFEPQGDAGIVTAQLPVQGSNIASGRAVIVVDKSIDEVLPVIVDYANYVRFMPNFTHSKVLSQRGNRAMVYMEVSVAKGLYTLHGQLDMAERPQDGGSRLVEVRLVEGNVNAFNASFKLTPVDGGARTEIDLNIYVDPDIPLPSSVFSRENERSAAKALRALRARIAETSGSSA
jgi:ribosome-associated toxin RatA of RatAB toxin-antitoxin module